MTLIEIVLIILAAFICELIDSSLGMLYGTILSPVLIIAGYDPFIVVPSILFSQAIGGLIASFGHHKLKNADFSIKKDTIKRTNNSSYIKTIRQSMTRDSKIVLVISCLGILATIASVFIAISIPKIILKTYIGILVFAMGIILLLRSKFNFSWKKIFGIGIISAFNKGLSGGGFGPVVTSGQLIAGINTKTSIGTTTLSEVLICITGFLSYLIIKGLSTWNFVLLLTAGAIIGAIIGPHITATFKSEKKTRIGLGILVTLLGIWTLIKTWII